LVINTPGGGAVGEKKKNQLKKNKDGEGNAGQGASKATAIKETMRGRVKASKKNDRPKKGSKTQLQQRRELYRADQHLRGERIGEKGDKTEG